VIVAVFLITLLQSAGDLLARGEYEAAIRQAQSAFDVHERAGAHADAAWDLNDIGLAQQYLGHYDAALDAYRRALTLDIAAGNADGEVTRLNNIGNVHFFLGRYSDADASYDAAWAKVETATSAKERGRLRKMTLSNMAVLAQRLGADERALGLYARIGASETMQPAEEAQLLVNRGALFRRLGDPVKALELYGRAQQLFARAAHRDGEIGAWRNIGIVRALDLHDNAGAFDAFDAALRLANESGNRLRIVQALLYRGEAMRRTGRDEAAAHDLNEALDLAASGKLVEEQWKALYSIGLLRRTAGDLVAARAAFERAITTIETVRSDLRTLTLRSEFLADKRDVYDALIWLRATERPVDPSALFDVVERSRARTWQDRVSLRSSAPSLAIVQSALSSDTRLLEYADTADGIVRIAVTGLDAGVRVTPAAAATARAIESWPSQLAARATDWRTGSALVGRALLDDVRDDPRIRHLIVSADGPLQFVPFEALVMPESTSLLVERFAVSYVPAAAWLARPKSSVPTWRWPWQQTLAAFADPAAASYPLESRPLPPLPYARVEAARAAAALGGRADVRVGPAATRSAVATEQLRGVPVVHFATHAVADTRDAERSRILLAPSRPGGPADYLFLRDIYDLDLQGVSLVALSACDTERGRIVRGEGVEGFSRALLAAGASATLTTLWNVSDRAGSELMTQFFYFAGRRAPTAEALRSAKLRLAQSNTAWSHPYFWAGYLLSGDGRTPLPRVIPLTVLGTASALALCALTASIRSAAAARRRRSLRSPAPQTHRSAPTR
jgi:CHAT domain-containing protein/tetratricopeptide (TPR) repeat protein